MKSKNSMIPLAGFVSGWSIVSDAIHHGTKVSSGYTANVGEVTLHSQGSIHAKNFYINPDGTIAIRSSASGNRIEIDADDAVKLYQSGVTDPVGLLKIDATRNAPGLILILSPNTIEYYPDMIRYNGNYQILFGNVYLEISRILKLLNVPASASGLPAGSVYRDANGFLKVVI